MKIQGLPFAKELKQLTLTYSIHFQYCQTNCLEFFVLAFIFFRKCGTTRSMSYRLYTTSVKAWDAMIEAIDQAQKSIYIEMYIFLGDTTESHDFIGKLKQKAAEGVKIVIVADAFGSSDLSKETVTGIRESGIEFIFFSHWLRHIHRKILIVDEKIAFIGGVNIGKLFIEWSDLQLKISGTMVGKILKSFAYTYGMSGGKDEKILIFREGKLGTMLKSQLIENWPIKNIYSLKNHYVEKITGAITSIKIITPYFTPPRWLISLLDDALRRKVRVEVLIPEKVDWKIFTSLNYRYINNLYPLGIKFYLTKNMNHSKLLIIDDEEALIGSQNIDPLSFELNYEAGIFLKEKKLAQKLSGIFEEWKNNSVEFEPKNYKMRAIDYVVLAITKILPPIL